jgi:lipopolysaccharide export LptBFGC system permease protein LptF
MQLGILESNINLSYQDYYNEYNKKISYINVIPDKSYEELISSNKLTIEYTGIITNDEDISLVQNVLSNYSSDSIIYLIKQENGLPTKLIVISKNTYYIINITGSKEVDNGIFTYEFDKNYNKINKITFNKYADSTVEDYDKYTLKNIFSIEIDTDYSYQNDIRGTYYLVKFSNSNIITNNLIEVDYNNDTSTYEELDISQYKNYVLISFGGYTYLVANSDLTLGYLSENKSFICNLGLC